MSYRDGFRRKSSYQRDEELAQLVGGADVCSSTYANAENCWWNDGCDLVIKSYENYKCGESANDKFEIAKKIYDFFG